MEELTERLAVPSGEVTIEGWYAGVPMVGIFVEGEMLVECTAEVARFFAYRLVSLPAAPALGREKTDTLAHEILAVCDALTQ